MTQVNIYTYVSPMGPGEHSGAWSYLLEVVREQAYTKEHFEGFSKMTRNRAEITALTEGLKRINRPCILTVNTQSLFITNAFTKGWVSRWQGNGWTDKRGEPVANKDLWFGLWSELKKHEYTFTDGHHGYLNWMKDNTIKKAKEVKKDV